MDAIQDSQVCCVCYSVLQSERDPQLQCPNQHSEFICIACFLVIEKCPICRIVIYETRKIWMLRCQFKVNQSKKMILQIHDTYLHQKQKYLSDQLKTIFQEKMYLSIYNLKASCVEYLENQARKIVYPKFLNISLDDQNDLKTIDSFFMDMNGRGRQQGTRFGQIMLYINKSTAQLQHVLGSSIGNANPNNSMNVNNINS